MPWVWSSSCSRCYRWVLCGQSLNAYSLHEPRPRPHHAALQTQGCPLPGHRARAPKPSTACPAWRRNCQLLPHTLRVLRSWHTTSLASDVVLLLSRVKRCPVGCTSIHNTLLWLRHELPPAPSRGRGLKNLLNALMNEQGVELSEVEAPRESLQPSGKGESYHSTNSSSLCGPHNCGCMQKHTPNKRPAQARWRP